MSDDPLPHVSEKILESLRQVPLFSGFPLQELQKVFGICYLHQYATGDTVYEIGSSSTEMFILLRGTLGVRTSADFELAQITPVGIVGEMGLITKAPRSARVVAIDAVMGFLIYKDDLDRLFVREKDIGRKMLLNVVKILCKRLRRSNENFEKLNMTAPGEIRLGKLL